MEPLSFRTNWSADARISSSVAGGSKFASVLMFRHMVSIVPCDDVSDRRGDVVRLRSSNLRGCSIAPSDGNSLDAMGTGGADIVSRGLRS